MAKSSIKIIKARPEHHEAIWQIFHEVVKSGDTYVYAPDTTREDALKIWCDPNIHTFVALHEGIVVGTYTLKANFPGLGSHIANCSYMVSSHARGLGVGRSMAQHSLEFAKDQGFISMQFNIVVSTNTNAVSLWKALGFEVVGTTPKGFRHAKLGFVDTYVMYRGL